MTNASFAYRWLADDVEIAGATASTYTLTSSEQGKTIKVRLSFTDDAGNEESVTSATTGLVAAAPSPLTATVQDTPGSHDGQNAFTFELHFSEEPRDDFSYRTLRDNAFTVTGGEVVNAQRVNPPSNVGWRITVQPSGDHDVTVSLPATTDCAHWGAVCTVDNRKLSSATELTVPGPVEQQVVNSPATGAPTIRGTVQVGETLTADTSGIADADGLTSATFTYGWLADDVEIAGATGSTYTLAADDEGKAIKVKVTFTDGRGQRRVANQRGDGSCGCCSISSDGQHQRRAGFPRRTERVHLRAAVQRDAQGQLQLQDPQGQCLHGDGRRGDQGSSVGAGQEHPVGDTHPSCLRCLSDHPAAGHQGLRCAGSRLHRRRQDAVRRGGNHGFRTRGLGGNEHGRAYPGYGHTLSQEAGLRTPP